MKEALIGILVGIVIVGLKFIFRKKDKGVSWSERNFTDLKYSSDPISKDIQKGMFLAAPYSVVSDLELDRLKVSSMNTAEEKANWKSSWSVMDHDSAIKNLKWLQLEGHRMNLYEIISIFNSGKRDGLTDDAIQLISLLSKAKNEIDIKGQLPPIGAWDYARMANNIRAFHSLGYINKEEAEHYLGSALRLAQQEYYSWEQYSQGFVLGRAVWAEKVDPQFVEVHHKLMKDKQSPYLRETFK